MKTAMPLNPEASPSGWFPPLPRYPVQEPDDRHYHRTPVLLTWCRSGVLAVTTDTTAMKLLIPFEEYFIEGVRITVSDSGAPTGAAIIVDLHKNGTTVFTTQDNRPSIAATETYSAAWVVPDIVEGIDTDVWRVNVDQVGSTVAGSNLTVEVWIVTLTE